MNNKTYSKSFWFVLPWDLYLPGGVNQVVTNLYDTFESKKYFIPFILINKWINFFPKKNIILGRRIFNFRISSPPIKNSSLFTKEFFKYLFFLPYEMLMLFFFVHYYKIEVVNLHFPGLYSLQFLLLKWMRLFKGKIIFSFHGSDVRCIIKTLGNESKLWRFMLKNVTFIVCCSNQLRKEVLSFCPDSKIQLTYNGIDIIRFLKEEDEKFHLPDILKKRNYILNIAAFEYQKGQDILLKAFKEVYELFPDLHLVMIGRTATRLEETKSIIKSYGLQDRVIIIENLDHSKIHTFYRNASLFVLPSRKEAFGIVLLEAGIFKLPVIASEVGGMQEIVVHEKSGILVPAEDYRALSQNMIYLLKHPEIAQQLGNELYKRVTEEFTWERAAKEYISLIK